MSTRWIPCSLLAALPLCGCTVGPDYQRPRVETPAHWVSPMADAPAAATQPSVAVDQPPPEFDITRWWATFNDPVLESLVSRALGSNLDLRVARLRVTEARAARRAAAAALYPRVDTSGSYRRSGGGPGRNNPERSNYSLGGDASWEIDVFGGVRRGVEASDADVRATVEDRRDVQVLVASEVALSYLDLRSFQRQLEISRQNLVLQRRSYDLTRQRFPSESWSSAESKSAGSSGAELTAVGVSPGTAAVATAASSIAFLLTIQR